MKYYQTNRWQDPTRPLWWRVPRYVGALLSWLADCPVWPFALPMLGLALIVYQLYSWGSR